MEVSANEAMTVWEMVVAFMAGGTVKGISYEANRVPWGRIKVRGRAPVNPFGAVPAVPGSPGFPWQSIPIRSKHGKIAFNPDRESLAAAFLWLESPDDWSLPIRP
jgi:hypothetical protein